MHEISLVRSLLKQVERLCKQNDGTAVEQIEVEIGPLSGVEPLLVREAFEILSFGTGCAGSRFVIHEVPLKARCSDCQAEFELPSFVFVCSGCQSRAIQITSGNEFRLLNVTIQANQAANIPKPRGGGYETEHIA
ncbi:Hydrogenase/urease nickel incorporation protein HypA [Symmachiella macrocystis]|uniref:Hydrogenase maturation factor HypA n=1 Tax=Symmachiella macrocystis TaxID=2527985 RepID=A0A5C6BBH2_9PLAN|nr:hydrogenase maturation nickel metallochaperone HypA [Symmachiella macrocystis]TWU08801.1 Hydrogenase/urease nickel incorporation protein HypA [Symmachiella macrocystis]